jgi:hypothetical protein
MLLVTLLSGITNPLIDYFGHLGGAIFGFLSGLGLSRIEGPDNKKLMRVLTLLSCGVLYGVFLAVFYSYSFKCA